VFKKGHGHGIRLSVPDHSYHRPETSTVQCQLVSQSDDIVTVLSTEDTVHDDGINWAEAIQWYPFRLVKDFMSPWQSLVYTISMVGGSPKKFERAVPLYLPNGEIVKASFISATATPAALWLRLMLERP
jgi:hypothetical protein